MTRFTAAALPALLLAATAAAQDTTGVHIGLTYAPGTRPAILVVPVAGAGGDSLRAILQRDLDYSDRVVLIEGPAVPVTTAGTIDYGLAAQLGAAAVVQGSVTATGVHLAVHDVAARRVLQMRDVALPEPIGSAEWRMALHGAADDVERTITGKRGIAATRVAFVAGGRLHLVDSDGWGERVLAPSAGPPLSPAWSPDGRRLAFSALAPRGARIMVRDLEGGTDHEVAGVAGGLSITPAFAPDGQSLVLAHGQDEGTDLYSVPMPEGAPARRVTVGRGSDNVSPSFSPDGRRLAFTSGRSGHPDVYITDFDGTNVDVLPPFEYGEQAYHSNPDWSPDGRAVAYQARVAGQFQVMSITLRDRSVKQVTSEGVNEDPSWAPDSRHLVFTSTRSGARELWVADVESGRVRQLTHLAGSRSAAWSRPLVRAP